MKLSMILPMAVMLGFNKYGQSLSILQIRAAYGTALASVLITAAFMFYLIQNNKEKATVETVTKQPGGGEKKEVKTVAQYDLSELYKSVITRTVVGAAIVIGLHSWKGFAQPLAIQAVLLPVQLFESPLFQIYILGKPAAGPLQRPFKEEKPFQGFTDMKEQLEEKKEEASEAVNTIDAGGKAKATPRNKKQS